MISVFEHPWLGGLFGDDTAAAFWSADTQLGHYRAFERALALALEAVGRVPSGQGSAAAASITTASIDIGKLACSTAADGLPVPELARQLRASAGPAQAAVHHGATSQDVLDTALALTLRDLTDLLIERLGRLDASLCALRERHGGRRLMGRTRMQAALPMRAADRIEAWRAPIAAHIAGLTALRPRVERLQLGGAVGNQSFFGDQSDRITEHMAESLGLIDGGVWHSDRTGLADYAGRLSSVSGSLGKMGQDVALMSQQGVDDIVLSGGGGSSAMPHKSNPVRAELLVTLARFNATLLSGMHHATIHEQERSGAAWMLEWMVLPQMAIVTARALQLADEIVESIEKLGEDPG